MKVTYPLGNAILAGKDAVLQLLRNRNTGVGYEITFLGAVIGSFEMDDGVTMNWFLDKVNELVGSAVPGKSRVGREAITLAVPAIISKQGDSLKQTLSELVRGEPSTIEISTQDDDHGTSDFFLRRESVSSGLSVKGGCGEGQDCVRNPAMSAFISKGEMHKIRDIGIDKLNKTYIPDYIQCMNQKYGCPTKWFRKRKKWEGTTSYIRNEVMSPMVECFNSMEDETKMARMSRVLQIEHVPEAIVHVSMHDLPNSKIIVTKPYGLLQKIKENPEILKTTEMVMQPKGQDVNFFVNCDVQRKRLAQMQVKFNNGILQRGGTDMNGSIPVSKEDGGEIWMKAGDPFNSYNFRMDHC